jgi:hypothetical protein
MKKIDLGQTITILANIGVIGGLIFVGLQLRQDRDIAESEALSFNQQLELEFGRFARENAGVWRKGLAGEPLTEDENVTFDLIANALFRIHANKQRRDFTFQGRTLGGDINSGARAYAFFVYEHPGLRAWFDRLVERRGYSDRAFGLTGGQFFPSNVRQYLQQLDEQEADIFPERRFYPY